MKTYDPKKHPISFAGILLNKGLAPGTFLTIASETPGFSSQAGVDGEVVRSRSHDRRATATFSVLQTSEINKRLSDLYNADRDAVNGQGVGAFQVMDLAGETVGRGSKAYIAKDPDVELGGEATVREWTIEISDWRITHGGNQDD